MTETRVIVTGSRNWTDYQMIYRTLEGLQTLWPDASLVIAHGAYRGADNLAEAAAKALGYATDPFPVTKEEWSRLKHAAGPIRNQRMVDAGADLCLGFPLGTSKGTFDCMKRAKAAKIRTLNVPEGKEF